VDAAKIRRPLLGHFAIDDAYFPISGVDELEKKLRTADTAYEFHRYEARHAFANETLVNSPLPVAYNLDAATLAWQRTMIFLGRHLKQYWA
jgi:carboxymethylenebutenolidase